MAAGNNVSHLLPKFLTVHARGVHGDEFRQESEFIRHTQIGWSDSSEIAGPISMICEIQARLHVGTKPYRYVL